MATQRVSPRRDAPNWRGRLGPWLNHPLAIPIALRVFQSLGLSASLFREEDGWWPLHEERNLLAFELEHGVEGKRFAYNQRCAEQVRRSLKTLRGEHAGYSNLFVPVVRSGEVAAIIATGPFSLSRVTSVEVLERWRAITGRRGHLADAGFASYLTESLATPVLEGQAFVVFERALETLATLFSGEGDAVALAHQSSLLLRELAPVRLAERMWNAAQIMLDDRSPRELYSRWRAWQMRALGLSRTCDHVLVGLTQGKGGEMDPVSEAVQNDALQRAAVELAARTSEVIAGKVGDHGVVFLLAPVGRAESARSRLGDFAERARTIARRRFGLGLHFGQTSVSKSALVSRSYQAALGAAESALISGAPLVVGEPSTARVRRPLWHAQQELTSTAAEQASLLPARFDRYLEAVALHSGYRFESAQTHLEVTLQNIADKLVASGALDQKSVGATYDSLTRAAAEVHTLSDLFAAYRRAVADMTRAVSEPAAAQRERHLGIALDHIHQHFAEALDFRRVARVAGFTPNYFSELFKKREGTTFERYVLGLRLERAKQLLARSTIDVTRVGKLCGFNSPEYFSRAFKKEVALSPREFRASQAAPPPPPGRGQKRPRRARRS